MRSNHDGVAAIVSDRGLWIVQGYYYYYIIILLGLVQGYYTIDSVDDHQVTVLHYGRCEFFDSGVVNLQIWISGHYSHLSHRIYLIP